MSSLYVKPSHLDETAIAFEQGAADVHQFMGQLSQSASQVSSGWSGSAAGSFDGMWQQWQLGLQRISSALSDIGTLLKESANAYQTTDEDGMPVTPSMNSHTTSHRNLHTNPLK